MQEAIVRIKRVVSRIVRDAKMKYRCPLGVWDSTGTLVGIGIDCPKTMGGVDCIGTATFTLNPSEYTNEETIKTKAELAVAALKFEVLVTIRPKAKAV